MIGTSTHIRYSRRVLYPSLSICTWTATDIMFNKDPDTVEDFTNVGLDLATHPNFIISPPVYSKLQSLQYYKFDNVTG